MKKSLSALLLAATATLLAAPASAQFAKSEDAIKYRQSVLFVMSQHFGRLGAMANGKGHADGGARFELPRGDMLGMQMAATTPWPSRPRGWFRGGHRRCEPRRNRRRGAAAETAPD